MDGLTKRLIMKNIFIEIALLLSFTVLMAQDNKSVRRILKSLKKEYGLSYADYRKSPSDNYSYIYLFTKDGHSMIADTLGQLIIPGIYPSQDKYISIEYIPSHKREFGKKRKYGLSSDCFYVGNQECFVAKEKSGNYSFYNQKGVKLSDFSGSLHKCSEVDGYLATSIPKGANDTGASFTKTNNIGFLSKDGTVLIPAVYYEIDATNMGICYVSQNDNGIIRHGAINIADTTSTDVPCLFNKVVLSNDGNTWLVGMHELDTLSVYSPDSIYSCTYIDDGERLYESGQYEEARKYYSIKHCDEPWTNAYLGACSWKLAVRSFVTAENTLEELGRTVNAHGHDIANTIYNQLDLFEKESRQAIKHFDLYLQGKDERYKTKIKEFKYDLVKIMEDSDILRKSVARELNAYEYRRETYLEEEHLKQIRKEKEVERQQEQQRINNQRLHEMNERNRIALERQKARIEEDRRQKTRQKRTKNNNKSNFNKSIPQSHQDYRRWHNGPVIRNTDKASSSKSQSNKKTNDAATGKEEVK